MDGFCMQDTQFPFVCVIVDDASTDGEQEVIQNYLEQNFDLNNQSLVRNEETEDYVLTFAQHKNNSNCYFGVLFLKYNHFRKKEKPPYYVSWSQAKYQAYCEGDDYWTHPKKLQMQVDFLESHPDYGLIYTDFLTYSQKEQKFIEWKYSRQADFNDMLIHNRVCTLTILIRTQILRDYNKEIKPIVRERKWQMGDYPLWLYSMTQAKAKFLPEVTGVYRKLESSASHFNAFDHIRNFYLDSFDVSFFFAKRFQVPKEIIQAIARQEVDLLTKKAQENDANLKFGLFKHMIKYRIFTIPYYISAKKRSNKKIRKTCSLFHDIISTIRCRIAIRTRIKDLFN
jgi:glycosyltransferase involved in cell wall biosynthesis